jgi:DNA gyrase subunit A
MVYKLKTWRLPLGRRNGRGKAIVNILPIAPGTPVAAIMPVDRDEDHWDDLQIVFATSAGDVRRNALSDFTNVMRNGKIAMKLPEGVDLVNARICDRRGRRDAGHRDQGPRDPLSDHRCSRLQGPRFDRCAGHRLAEGDRVVSMAVIRHFEASPEDRAAYLKMRRPWPGCRRRRSREEEAPAAADFTRSAMFRCRRPRT